MTIMIEDGNSYIVLDSHGLFRSLLVDVSEKYKNSTFGVCLELAGVCVLE